MNACKSHQYETYSLSLQEMETRDQEVLAKLDTIIDGDEPDDEVISKLLQTHMETTGALSRYHDQELSRHQAAVMAKLKQRMKAMENNNLVSCILSSFEPRNITEKTGLLLIKS